MHVAADFEQELLINNKLYDFAAPHPKFIPKCIRANSSLTAKCKYDGEQIYFSYLETEIKIWALKLQSKGKKFCAWAPAIKAPVKKGILTKQA